MPVFVPRMIMLMIPLRRPSAITTVVPVLVAAWAASSLLAIPPVESAQPLPEANASTSGVMFSKNATRWERRLAFVGICNPLVVVRIISKSALISCPTSEASKSLSPNLISSTATASFSLTTGMTPARNMASMVLRALRCRERFLRSSCVNSTCPILQCSWAKKLS